VTLLPPNVRRIPLRTGLGLHLLEWGREHDHTVLLVHGFLDHAWAWEDVATRLASRFHVLAPDMRGHGDSDRVGAGGYYHFMDYVADVAALVDACARPRLAVVGHSMGGGIVGYYAGTYPQRLTHAAFLEGLGPPEQEMEPARVAAWVQGWARVAAGAPHRKYATLEAAADRLQANDSRLERQLALRLAEKGTRENPDGTRSFKHDPLHLTTGPYGFTFEAAARFWRRVTCPVLLIEGADSDFRLSPEETARRHGCFVNARHEIIPGAAHMMHRDKPVDVADALLRFLTA
jgi:pimeloyl-ACP methyl ester carboxylesterase